MCQIVILPFQGHILLSFLPAPNLTDTQQQVVRVASNCLMYQTKTLDKVLYQLVLHYPTTVIHHYAEVNSL